MNDLSTQQEAALFRDLKKKLMLEIEELTFLARKLPEKQLAKIFNSNNLVPFMKSVLDVGLNPEKLEIEPSKWDHSAYLEFENSNAFQKKISGKHQPRQNDWSKIELLSAKTDSGDNRSLLG